MEKDRQKRMLKEKNKSAQLRRKRWIEDKELDSDKDTKCLTCRGPMPEWRIRDGRINCSSKCSNKWNHLTQSERERLRNKKYNTQLIKSTSLSPLDKAKVTTLVGMEVEDENI